MALPKRIIKETERLVAEPVPGINAVPHEDNLRYFDVTIHGPAQSPYEGGIFRLELFLPEDYPMTPPKIRFLTKIYHPNIDKLGRICLDVLKGNWSPALQIRTILLSIQALLGAPNPDDPLANDVAQRWKEDEKSAIQTENCFLLLKMWTSSIRIMLSFPNGPKQNIKALMAPDFTTAARYRKSDNIPAAAPESRLSMRVATTRLPPETANQQPRASKTNYVDYSQLKERKWEGVDPSLKPAMVAKPKVDSDRKPKSKKWKKKKKPTKGGSVQSPLAPTQDDAGQPTPTTTTTIASGPPNRKTERKGPSTNQRKKRVPPLVLPIRNKRLSDDIPSPVTESNGGVALAGSTVGKDSGSDDVPGVVVAAESFFISVMDPDDPRAKLPVPERNVPPVDPNHARLSWTACYDDDCPVHLSDKNGAGWFPCRPYESRRRGSERS